MCLNVVVIVCRYQALMALEEELGMINEFADDEDCEFDGGLDEAAIADDAQSLVQPFFVLQTYINLNICIKYKHT